MKKILEVKHISKTYKKNLHAQNTISSKNIFDKWKLLFKNKIRTEEIAALRDVSFDLEDGDVLGIIGRNGAGKTTLLNILAGVVQPVSGNAVYEGRLLSILEFGTGFHPDLTGSENIYLNASMLGMPKTEIKKRFKDIVEFSELKDFINEPVKHYSNGMYLRLAFSVFTHLNTDILLLDEVISVGDFPFRQKCYKKISDLAKAGTTIIMVSHYPDQVKELCNKCLWLENGAVAAFGEASVVLNNYLEKYLVTEAGLENDNSLSIKNYFLCWSNGFNIKNEIKILHFGVKAKNKKASDTVYITDDVEIEIEFEKLNNESSVEVTISICSMYEAWVLVDSYALYTEFENKVKETGQYVCKCALPGNILNFGVYQLGLLISKAKKLIYQNPYLINFKIEPAVIDGVNNNLAKEMKGIIKPVGEWSILH